MKPALTEDCILKFLTVFILVVLFFPLIFPGSVCSKYIDILSYLWQKLLFPLACDLQGWNASHRGILSWRGSLKSLCGSDSSIKTQTSTVSQLPSHHTFDPTHPSLPTGPHPVPSDSSCVTSPSINAMLLCHMGQRASRIL